MCKYLIELGADVNQQASEGNVLAYASPFGKYCILLTLNVYDWFRTVNPVGD